MPGVAFFILKIFFTRDQMGRSPHRARVKQSNNTNNQTIRARVAAQTSAACRSTPGYWRNWKRASLARTRYWDRNPDTPVAFFWILWRPVNTTTVFCAAPGTRRRTRMVEAAGGVLTGGSSAVEQRTVKCHTDILWSGVQISLPGIFSPDVFSAVPHPTAPVRLQRGLRTVTPPELRW